MWYIIKPILKILFAIIYITWKCIEYAFYLLLNLLFLFKWVKYSELNNNEGEMYVDGWNIKGILPGDRDYMEQKNPIQSYRWICEFFKQ